MYQRFTNPAWTLLLMISMATLAVPAFTETRTPVPSGENRNTLVVPYIAVGGEQESWHFLTVVTLKNTDRQATSGTIEFFDDDGSPMRVQLNDGAALAAQSEWSVASRQSKLLTLSHSGGTLQGGWLRIRYAGTSPIAVSGTIEFYNGDDFLGKVSSVAHPSDWLPVEFPRIEFRGPKPAWPMQHFNTEGMLLASYKPEEAPNAVGTTERTTSKSCNHPPAAAARTSAHHFVQTGYASWYGDRFHGRVSASGEIYDQRKLTAAHRTLPLGTKVRITNLRNGCSVIVRIEDRGPHVRNRIVDLSPAAARQIGLTKSGVSRVRLERYPS